ncbi:thiamine phosphate synthase [Reichenbachiella sp.]|uniref:thiamine phosphate synthase n=1 Tax=Reichenbachiella sp. TaxID=2184521 RepID=UPI003BAE1FD5
MKTIVITPEIKAEGEIETCNLLLKSDIERLHVRKPFASEDQMRAYVEVLDSKHYDKVSLHSHHNLVDEFGLGGKHFKSYNDANGEGQQSKSFHHWDEIKVEKSLLTYGFLSPIFESISKSQYKSDFNHHKLNEALTAFDKFPIYALGGIDIKKMKQIQEMNFEGVALLGTVWMESSVSRRIAKTTEILNA